MSSQADLLADQPSELERLQLQSRVWEPSGRRVLDEIGEVAAPASSTSGVVRLGGFDC